MKNSSDQRTEKEGRNFGVLEPGTRPEFLAAVVVADLQRMSRH